MPLPGVSDVATKCSAFVRTCPGCKKRLPENGKAETCPECGACLRCDNFVVPGYNYCSVHGGPAPSRNFYGKGRGMTTGKGSNFQLTRIASKYNEIQRNGQILSNRRARDIIWHRVEELAADIDTKDAPDKLEKLGALWKDYRGKQSNGLLVEAALVAKDIDDEFEKAYYLFQAWRQMFQALELHSKMTESEVKIMKDLKAIMTYEDANLLVAKIMAVFLRILQDDPKRLKEAQYELTRLTGDFADERPDNGTWARGGEGDDEERSSLMDREGVLDSGDEGQASEADGLPQGYDAGGAQ
jgi:hypothetical protein